MGLWAHNDCLTLVFSACYWGLWWSLCHKVSAFFALPTKYWSIMYDCYCHLKHLTLEAARQLLNMRISQFKCSILSLLSKQIKFILLRKKNLLVLGSSQSQYGSKCDARVSGNKAQLFCKSTFITLFNLFSVFLIFFYVQECFYLLIYLFYTIILFYLFIFCQ